MLPNLQVYITHDIFNNGIEAAEVFAFLQGANYHLPPSDKVKNQIATIIAILSIEHPEINHDQVRDVFFGNAPKCIAKDLQIIRNVIKAFQFIINSVNSTEKSIDIFLKTNKILKLNTTVFSVINQIHFPPSRMQDIIMIFKEIVDKESINHYIKAIFIFKTYSEDIFFDEYNKLTWFLLCLFILFKNAPPLVQFDLTNLISTLIRKKSDSLENNLLAMFDEIHKVSYPTAIKILNQTNATTDNLTRQMRRLLSIMVNIQQPISSRDLMVKFKHSDLSTFRKNYLSKAVSQGLVIRCLPEHPTSQNQTYKISQKGIDVMSKINI